VAKGKSDAVQPERMPVVVLYAETRGFTRASETLEPAVVMVCISEFFATVRSEVERREGIVRSVLNDTLAASFTGEGHAARAVEAAQAIQDAFTAIEEKWERDHGLRAAVAIGLHAGDAVVGRLDGSAPPQSLIVGDTLSIAERLLHRARAGEYVLSKTLVDVLAVTGVALEAEELPVLEIPRRDPIRLYGVVRDEGRLDFT
jgi:adenylate cyclase